MKKIKTTIKHKTENALKTVFINFNFCLYYASVVLLDTTKEATLEWTRYPYGPQAQTPGVSQLFKLTLTYRKKRVEKVSEKKN